MRHLIIVTVLSLSPIAAIAAEPAPSPRPMHHDGAAHGTATGGGAGKATFKEFTVTKKTDSASTGLMKCAGGVTVQRPDGTQACDDSSSASSDMAINEKGTGTDPEPKKTPK